MSFVPREQQPRADHSRLVMVSAELLGPRRIFGLETCPDCGEQRGSVEAIGPDGRITWRGPLACACQGPLCRYCGRQRVRLPASDRLVRESGEIVHTPWYAPLVPCDACQREGRGPEVVSYADAEQGAGS